MGDLSPPARALYPGQFRERGKRWRVEKINIQSRKDIGLVTMISKGGGGTQAFVSRVTI
jgi:hypothetical protein